MAGRTWPAQPLIDATGLTLRQVARRLRIDPANLCRPLTDRQADRWATDLDLRPQAVWGPTWFDDDEE